MTDPDVAFSGEAKHASLSKAFNTDKSFWEFSEQPDQRARRTRFAVAMAGTQAMEPPGLPILGKKYVARSRMRARTDTPPGYQWGSLPDGATVVDVGGGVGTVSLQLAEIFPKLQYVVQDLPAVVEEGKKVKTRLMIVILHR